MPTSSGYISPDEIIADATSLVDDEGFKKFSYGSYLSEVQQALGELAFDTHFDDKVWYSTIPPDLQVQLPEGVVSIERMFVYNGECSPTSIVPLRKAVGFTRMKGATFKEQMGIGNTDAIMDDVYSYPHGVPYYNTIGGVIMLSDACVAFSNIMVRYKGLGCNLGDAPVIPYELRQAVKLYVANAQLTKLFAREPARWGAVLQNVKRDLHVGNGPLDPGAWVRAKRRVQAIDKKEARDIALYLTRLQSPPY